jgi:hypothetical protein
MKFFCLFSLHPQSSRIMYPVGSLYSFKTQAWALSILAAKAAFILLSSALEFHQQTKAKKDELAANKTEAEAGRQSDGKQND